MNESTSQYERTLSSKAFATLGGLAVVAGIAVGGLAVATTQGAGGDRPYQSASEPGGAGTAAIVGDRNPGLPSGVSDGAADGATGGATNSGADGTAGGVMISEADVPGTGGVGTAAESGGSAD